MKMTAYLSFVRSSLEYCSTIWDPYHDTEIDRIEMVQNRAIRWIHGYGPREQCSVSQLRQELKLDTLKDRRSQHRLTLLYKVVNDFVAITVDDLGLKTADRETRAKKHGKAFYEKHYRLDRLKYSMVLRTVRQWNELPAQVAEEEGSVDTFKSLLSAHCP